MLLFVKLFPGNGNWTSFMEVRMQNKRHMCCQNVIKVFGRKIRVSILLHQFDWRNGVKELSGKWPNSIVQATLFFWGRTTLPFSIHCIVNHTRERLFYNVRFLEWEPELILQSETLGLSIFCKREDFYASEYQNWR